MASGRKQADARYDYCPCTPCRTHDPPFIQQRRTIHRHRQREEMNLRDKALATARTGKTSFTRALKKSDNPGIPSAVKGFRVGRTGYVIASEASTGLGGPFPLGRAPEKSDDPGIPNAVKGFRVGRTGYVIAGEASTGLLRRAPKKSDNPGISNAVKGFRVGKMGYEIAGEPSTGLGGPFSLRRAPNNSDNPGIPNAVKGYRVGRTGYVIASEASTGPSEPLHLGRAPDQSDNPGIPNAVKGFRVGRTGYVIAGEASTGPLRRAPKKSDNPGISNAVKGFRVGRTGYVIASEPSTRLGPVRKNAATESIYALDQGTGAGGAAPRALPASMSGHPHDDEASIAHEDVAPSSKDDFVDSLSRSGLPFTPVSTPRSDFNPSGPFDYPRRADDAEFWKP